MPEAAAPMPDTAAENMPSSERRCLATGEMLPKGELIRFVVGPDHSLVPDLAQNLPGRGLWVKADRAALTLAAEKNLFAKAAKTSVKIPAEFLEQVTSLLRRRCLDFLGLAKRAGIAVLGQPQVEAALKARKLALLLIADDAAGNLPRTDLAPVRFLTRTDMGAALGYGQNVYVGFMPHALTDKLKTELARLEKIALQHHINEAKTDG